MVATGWSLAEAAGTMCRSPCSSSPFRSVR